MKFTDWQVRSPTVQFDEVVVDASALMGVKAVFGAVRKSRVMCFGSRGDLLTGPNRHFQAARSTAKKAMQQRWLITIGGGADVPPRLRGRVINLASVSSTYGETTAFVEDPDERALLAQWPTAVALRDVYEVEGFPHLIRDLRFPDLQILENAFDQVLRPEERVQQLWEVLRERQITLSNLSPLLGFNDEDRLVLVAAKLPGKVSAVEGKELRKEAAKSFERDPALARSVKDLNRSQHGGLLVCEGCGFSDIEGGLFDAHHLVPLALKVRKTVLSDMAVLCPTCHRVCHRRGSSDANPLPLPELRDWWEARSQE